MVPGLGQVESNDTNYEFLLNYLGLFSTIPIAKETEACLGACSNSHDSACVLRWLWHPSRSSSRWSPSMRPGRRCRTRSHKLARSCCYLNMYPAQEWATVEGGLHRALGAYVHRRCSQNLGARPRKLCMGEGLHVIIITSLSGRAMKRCSSSKIW